MGADTDAELEEGTGPTVDSGSQKIAPGISLIKECIVGSAMTEPESEELREWYDPGVVRHSSQSAYLLTGEKTLLFDTASPAGTNGILDNLDHLLDGAPLDYLAISHPEANHAGNTWDILQEYPEATLVAAERGSGHELFDLTDEVMYVSDGDTIDLGGHVVEFHEPLFYDHAMTVWMSELDADILFTVDFLGFSHMDGECLKFADELKYDVTEHQLRQFNGYAFTWFRYADPKKTDEAIDRIRKEHDPSMIAPAHGQVIREDVEEYLETMKSVIRNVSDRDGDYHIHVGEDR